MSISPHFPQALNQYLVANGYQTGSEYLSKRDEGKYSLSVSSDDRKAKCVLREWQMLEGVPCWNFIGTYVFSGGKEVRAVEVSQEKLCLKAFKVETLIERLKQKGPYLRE